MLTFLHVKSPLDVQKSCVVHFAEHNCNEIQCYGRKWYENCLNFNILCFIATEQFFSSRLDFLQWEWG